MKITKKDIGSFVYNEIYGVGTIITNNNGLLCQPITVKFEDKEVSYRGDGKTYHLDKYPSIFFVTNDPKPDVQVFLSRSLDSIEILQKMVKIEKGFNKEIFQNILDEIQCHYTEYRQPFSCNYKLEVWIFNKKEQLVKIEIEY